MRLFQANPRTVESFHGLPDQSSAAFDGELIGSSWLATLLWRARATVFVRRTNRHPFIVATPGLELLTALDGGLNGVSRLALDERGWRALAKHLAAGPTCDGILTNEPSNRVHARALGRYSDVRKSAGVSIRAIGNALRCR
jgi:hypothetical protein